MVPGYVSQGSKSVMFIIRAWSYGCRIFWPEFILKHRIVYKFVKETVLVVNKNIALEVSAEKN